MMCPVRSNREICSGGGGNRSRKIVAVNGEKNFSDAVITRKISARRDEVGSPGASEESYCLLARVQNQIHRVQDAE
jgi:hypothetical protein